MRCESPKLERHSLEICWPCSEGRADQPPAPRGPPSLALEGRRKNTTSPGPLHRGGPGDCFCGKTNPALDPREGGCLSGARPSTKGLRDRLTKPTTLRMRMFQHPLQMERSQSQLAAPSLPRSSRTSRRRRDRLPQKVNVTEVHVTVLPRHTLSSAIAAYPNHPLRDRAGPKSPWPLGLPRLGALSIHGR
jgi:hypothetical protein